MLKYRNIAVWVCLFAFLFAFSAAADSAVPYENYNYSNNGGNLLPAPQAYIPERQIFAPELGLPAWITPTDLHAAPDGKLYILDGGSGSITVINSDFQCVGSFTGFEIDAKPDDFEGAQGLFVTQERIYIADTQHERIVVLTLDGKFIEQHTKPESPLLNENFIFKPARLAVDANGILYIVGQGIFEGIVTLNPQGNFDGFIGANRVVPDPMLLFWLRFASKSQRDTMLQFIPVSHSSVDIDDDGFLYCTTLTEQDGAMVQKLNQGGGNILRSLSNVSIIGDLGTYWYGAMHGKSVFVDAAHGENGIYACLDSTRGKVFCYNNDGYLLYTFGTLSAQLGGFRNPVALTFFAGRVAVIDREKGSVTFFAPTEYAKQINSAVADQMNLEYDKSYGAWQKVLALNNRFELAHVAIGNVHYREGRYKDAMKSYQSGGSKDLYSKALEGYRAEWITDYVWLLAGGLFALLSFITALVIWHKGRRRRAAS